LLAISATLSVTTGESNLQVSNHYPYNTQGVGRIIKRGVPLRCGCSAHFKEPKMVLLLGKDYELS